MSRNQLDQETSPYLLQHKDNPVHWRPWGPEALFEAQVQNKPILLSVGYAACHWCHVMAHESFENIKTAQLMNELFIPIKVDREERPDIDGIYQNALSMLGQQGGWPLTMFLTPDGKPFWGGTYFPPTPRYGRPAFDDILTGIAQAYRDQPEKIETNVTALENALSRLSRSASARDQDIGGMVSIDLIDQAAAALTRAIDPVRGGFSGAPKFPQIPQLFLIWKAAVRLGDPTMEHAVLTSLEHMSQGGIYDHLGGGFARYSTDENWLAPHFEKMLYDNAQAIDLLTQAWQHTRNPLYRQRVEETVGWLFREMMAEHDMFAATLDADSEGEEGRFYVWDEVEIDEIVPRSILKVFKAVYDVTFLGNWEGKNILHRNGHQPFLNDQQKVALEEAKAKLLTHREGRVRPGRDDKILADWNGMMIAALANAGFVFRQSDWIEKAEQAYRSVKEILGSQDGEHFRLVHCYRLGKKQPQAMLDDYAQMARAALLLHEITGGDDYLIDAIAWVKTADRHYWDPHNGGYFFTADDAPGLIVRTKAAFDHATPSGNGVMVEVLARLYHLTEQDAYRQRAEEVVSAFAGELSGNHPNMASLLCGWEFLYDTTRIVLIRDPQDPVGLEFLRVIADSCLPNRLLDQKSKSAILANPDSPYRRIVQYSPGAVASVCKGQSCTPPLTDAGQLRAALHRQ